MQKVSDFIDLSDWTSTLKPAVPPKADMGGATGDVRFGPIADIADFTRSLRRRDL